MICTPELINGRWVLPLSEELLDGVGNPAEVEFDVRSIDSNDSVASEMAREKSVDGEFVDALEDVIARRASTLKRLAQ